jgi:MFS family permease
MAAGEERGTRLGAASARLIAGQVCVHATMAGTRMAAPLLALDQGYNKLAVGFLVALFALGQVFLSLPAGRFADRHGFKRPVGWSVCAACAGVGLAVLWPVYGVLCVSAFLSGAAIAGSSIALQRHLGKLAKTPAELKKVFSWVSMAPAAANAVGPAIAGVTIDLAGYRAALFVLAAMPLATWLLARTEREVAGDHASTARQGTAWDLLRQRGVRPLLLMNFFVSASWDLHGFMVPILGHERQLQASVIGTIMAAFAIGAAASRLAMPVIARRIRAWMFVSGAVASAGLLLLVYPFTHSAVTMGFCSTLMGMALGCVQPMVMSLLYQLTPPHRRGEVLAIRLIMINASSVSMPLLLGATSAVMGVSVVFWAMGFVAAAGSAFGRLLRGVGEGTH